jgi:hypothetical protein
MSSGTIKNCSIAAFFLTLAVCAIVVTRDFHSVTGEAHGPLVSLNQAAGDVAEYVRTEKLRMEDPKNEKALDAAIQVGAVFNASGRLLNTQVMPRLWKEIDALHTGTDALTSFVHHSDDSLNLESGLLPASTRLLTSLTKTADKFGVTVDELSAAIKIASDQTGLGLKEIQRRMADPRWDALMDNIVDTSKHVDGTAAQVEGTMTNVNRASASLPDIADSLSKIAKTSSKFAKAYWLSRIISVFLPLVP